MANRNLTTVVYTDDEGNQYAMKMDAHTFGAELGDPAVKSVGGADYDGDPPLPPMPVNLRPRAVRVSAAGGNKRRVICLEPTAPLFVGTHTTIPLQVLGAADVTYTRVAKVAEQWKRRGDPND